MPEDIRFEVNDLAVIAHLDRVEPVVFASIENVVMVCTYDLEAYIEQNKLQGQVLRHITGKLSASVHSDFPIKSQTEIQGRVSVSPDVPYAAIHEFGGTIPAHDIVPVNAQALHFVIDGVEIFAKRVHIPDVIMPERSYMRTSLRENAEKYEMAIIRAAITSAVAGHEVDGEV